jgi:aspartate/glutamate racemase
MTEVSLRGQRRASRLIIPETVELELKNARRLLGMNEENIPEQVEKVIKHCASRKVGFILSRNGYAGNCRDARSKRSRLGHTGIPLYDELKSIVGVAIDKNSNSIIVAMHCRGHMAINFEQVAKLCEFQSDISSLPEDELLNLVSMKFGTVNPILLDLASNQNVLQVFDISVLEQISRFPGTMMTNAGDHTWGIEFDPWALVDSIDNKIIGQIADSDTELKDYELPHRLNPKSIGIITGNGPDSGIALWQDINEHIVNILGDHFLGDISLPQISVISVPALGLSMELDQREQTTWEALSDAVKHLKNQRVELLALACHTTHYFTDKIREIFDNKEQRFISMPEVVIKYIEETNMSDLAILGINYVADLGEWSAYSKLSKYNIEKLSYETIRKFHQLGYDVKKMSQRHKSFQQLIRLIKSDVKSKNVLIALTELSILLQSQGKSSRSSDKNIVDVLELYAKAIAEESLGISK